MTILFNGPGFAEGLQLERGDVRSVGVGLDAPIGVLEPV